MIRKFKWIGAFLVVFFLIIATNLVDQGHYDRIETSVKNIYDDRLVAQDLLFEISLLVNEKKIKTVTADTNHTSNEDKKLHKSIQVLIEQFKTTVLTNEEELTLKSLEENVKGLFTSTHRQDNPELSAKLLAIDNDLYHLSKIQLKEAKRERQAATSSMEMLNLFTRMEIIMLIVLGLVIQIIILYSPKKEEEG